MALVMPRGRRNPYTKKERIGITPDPEIMVWVLPQVGPGKRFASVTHAFEYAMARLRDSEETKT